MELNLIQKSAMGNMKEYKFTGYFENEVLRKRSYLKKEWCLRIIEQPLRIEEQENEIKLLC